MMIKKIAIIFTLAFIALGVNAQLPVGGWTIHSPFGGVSSIAETKNKTYYLSVGSLFSVDKNTLEVRSLNISNELNGSSIKGIYPHPEGKYIIVAYNNCNIDRLNDDGSVINISDISDALITGKPAITHIGFGKDRIYVATTFGLVTIDDKKNETVETMFSPAQVDMAFGLGDHVVIGYGKQLLAAPASEHLVSIDKFKIVGGNANMWTFGDMSKAIGDKRVIFTHKSGNNKIPVIADFDFDADRLATTIVKHNNANYNFTSLVPVGSGQVFVTNGSNMLTFGADTPANAPDVTTLPAILKGQAMSAFDGLDRMWGGNADGICMYDISDRANPVQLGEKFGKTEFATVQCNAVSTQTSGDILFWNKCHEAGLILGYSNTAKFSPTSYSNIDGFKNISPQHIQANNGIWVKDLTGQMWMAQDPIDPEAYFVGTWSNGLYRIKNGEQTHHLTSANSPILNEGGSRVAFIVTDSKNNIWIGQEAAITRNNNVHGINAAAFQEEDIPRDSWSTTTVGFVCRVSEGICLRDLGIIVSTPGYWSNSLYFIKVNADGTFPTNPVIETTSYIDQDNKTLSFSHIPALCEDKKGRLWVGTDNGIFEITDPSKIDSDVAQVNHLKVPRNDGTGLADYLLDAVQVNGIAVDNSNRKWIATATSGVYLVSEDGDQILEHYDINNSILPSNKVFSVACDPNSSSVFFATDAGVVEYNSTSAPASENLDDVYAYPNPVRPDYSGWITVTGLMDNTLVKIADSAGNVFFQGRSEGGMITWDGCNANGDRVKTGVYYVFASHGTSNDSNSDNCVTKIMVIN